MNEITDKPIQPIWSETIETPVISHDLLAAIAMHSIISGNMGTTLLKNLSSHNVSKLPEIVASTSHGFADAMLAESKKRKGNE